MTSPNPFDHHGYWMKAKLFLNWAMDPGDERTFQERALWASLALELLAKSALSHHSPLLVADPTEDGANLLVASGLIERDSQGVSARAKTVFSRCARAFKPFDLKQAMAIANARNEFLHGTLPVMTPVPEHAWWPRFWAQASILVTARERDIEDLVGIERLAEVEAHLEQNQRNVADRVQTLIEAAVRRRTLFEQGSLPARVHRELQLGANHAAGMAFSDTVTCPACDSEGIVEGDEPYHVETEYLQISEDDYEANVTVSVLPEFFSCGNCGLILDRTEFLDEAGLGDLFYPDGDFYDLLDGPEYGNE